MGEENHKQIPVLDDVVELGSGIDPETGEENIRIVADNALQDEFDDPYDDEFKKLFDNATDTGPEADASQLTLEDLDVDADTSLASDDTTPETDDSAVGSMASAEPQLEQEPTIPDIAANEEVILTAETETLSSNEAEDDLWLSEWQEDTTASNVIEQHSADADDTLDILHSKAEIEITDEETAALIAAAVEEDDIPPEMTVASTVASDENTAASDAIEATETAATPQTDASAINTGELVDQIVTELLPEIEWKLRTKVREVLEQHFPPVDD